MENYININKVAEAKGLKSTRSLRIEINKPESKYISRPVQVNGGTSYEILFESLEPDIQQKLRENETISTALVPLNYQPPAVTFTSESARLTSLARVDIVKALLNLRKKYTTQKEADAEFLDLYNSGLYLPKIYNFIGSISIGTLHRWVKKYQKYETAECLVPRNKVTRQGEYNTILNSEMKQILLTFLLHQNKFKVGKAIKLTKEILIKRGYEELPCDLTFKRYAEHFRKNHYEEWVLKREGMKAYHDKVEPYIERDLSKIEVGDVIIADGHVLNFQVINPFTGKATRATLVGFLDWKSTALIGYEIMMTENTQCIASALRNAILNLGLIPKVVYQDNGKAFKSKYFQNVDFDEEGFNGVYANLGIHSVFAKPYNARAKVIERFFLEFQEEFEKMMASYIGTSIEDKPAWTIGKKLLAINPWIYVAIMDASTRPEHAELNGMVYRYDDPFWRAFYPPNGWRCRCRVNALSDYKLQKRKLPVSSSDGYLSEEQRLVSKKSGEYKPVTVYTDPLTGRKIAPDVGWSHNPASGLINKN